MALVLNESYESLFAIKKIQTINLSIKLSTWKDCNFSIKNYVKEIKKKNNKKHIFIQKFTIIYMYMSCYTDNLQK